jgi:hypothetical protein
LTEYLFDRKVSFQFGLPGQMGKKFTDLRVTFDIELSSKAEPNKCKMQIFNLTQDSRALTEKEGLQVLLQAGYGQTLETIFQGDVKRVLSHREGSEIITDFEAGDGENSFTNSTVNKSFSPGISFESVITYVASSFGIPAKVQGVQTESYLNGVTLSGSAKDSMTELTKKQGLLWYIQNGTLIVLKDGEGTGEQAVRLAADTGLIGSPKKKDKGIEITCLLNPKIQPERPVFLDAKNIKGVILPKKVKHKGDSHGGDFHTIIEADFK